MSGLYERAFGTPPAASEHAPARVNLLGEHTDYNDGFVLPTPLPFATRVSVGRGARAGMVDGCSQHFGSAPARPLNAGRKGDWLDYVVGCVQELAAARGGEMVDSLHVAVESDVPVGAGLSSSAALEVATLRALRRWLAIELGDEELARLAQRAECQYVGMPCGIMDQTVSSLGRVGQALFLDTRTLAHEDIPLPERFGLAVVHCGLSHNLTDSGYAERRQECRRAAAALGVQSLRDLEGNADVGAIDRLAPPLDRRVRHVRSENARVLSGVEALRRQDMPSFGALMNESHRSQRDDYEVSVPEIDEVVDAALRRGALGVRLTGGGFGGSVVALVPEVSLASWWQAVSRDCPAAWLVFPALRH